jgi:hypothetical protein
VVTATPDDAWGVARPPIEYFVIIYFYFFKKKKKLGLQEEKKKLNPFHSQGIAIPINGVQPNNKIVIP